MTAIKTEKLTKRYNDVIAVNALDISIDKGEIFALLGVNGAGKTTTIKMLCALTKPTEGDAFIFGRSVVTDAYAVKSMIDVSMQETAVARNLTVKENLMFYADIVGLDKATAQARIAGLIKTFDLYGVLKKKAKTLSGGWQRKLSIALALLSEPEVLFLDEPTLGLDVLARRELWSFIRGLKGKLTIILTTHYMEEADSLADRVGIMKAGRLLVVDTPENLIKRSGAQSFEDAFVAIIEKDGAGV